METEPEKPLFKAPEKLIRTAADMQTWEKSETFYEILGFINSLSYIIQGKSNSYKCDDSKPIQKILEMLDSMEKLAKDTPPIDQPARFGNASFRTWFEKMKNVGIFLLLFSWLFFIVLLPERRGLHKKHPARGQARSRRRGPPLSDRFLRQSLQNRLRHRPRAKLPPLPNSPLQNQRPDQER